MADTAAENEADTSGPVVVIVPQHHDTSDGATSNNQDDDNEQNDNNVTGSIINTNYDSSDNTTTPTTSSTTIPTIVGTTTITTTHRCNRCDFEAVSQTALQQHINQTHNNNNSSSNNNNNNNNSNSSGEVKMEVENNNSPPADRMHRKMFECDVCNMKFSNGANMRRHKMRHTGVKPYECRVCQKRFFRKDHLAEHFTTHTKTLPYHCPICNRGFQRQIAMRAHFQNEHVGQHDLVKSCPLCSYRAGSMKSLRVHFFNRHGIDLDNPGPAGSQASLFAAAAQQGFSMDSALTSLGNLAGSVSVSVTGANYSDSGDSTGARSTDNATPPMHFLTPHVEISMADAPASVFSPTHNEQRSNMPGQSGDSQRMNGECPGSPQSADSNSNAPSSSLIQSTNSLRLDQETNITPSISLIPIKQEPGDDLYDITTKRSSNNNNNNNNNGQMINHPSTSPSSGSVQMQTATSSSLSSLIKVSPLKSLLRDDLKRKIVSRMNSSPRGHGHGHGGGGGGGGGGSGSGRSTSSPNQHPETSPSDTTTTTTTNTNGAITSTGPEQPSDSTLWRQINKRTILTSLQCIFCGIGFPDQTLYFLHKGCHSDANPWKCNICGEQCCNVYEFNSHLLSKSHQ